MNYIDYLNIFIKYFFINLLTCYICFKISNLKLSNPKIKLITIAICIIISVIFTFCSKFFYPSSIIILSYFILSLLYFYITKYKIDYSIVVTFVALTLTIILYVISIFTILFICMPFSYLNKQSPIILIFTMILESLLVFFIFRIKRFRNGLSFFKNKSYSYILVLFLSGIVVLLFTTLGNYISNFINEISLLGLTLILLSMFIWIKEKITLHYKSLLVKDTIQNLQNKLNEQIYINETMKDEIEKLSMINHKFSSRISALELYVEKLSCNPHNNIEVNNDIKEAKKLTKSLSIEFSNEMQTTLKNNFLINKTGIINIDNILEYFELECRNKNISFNVIVKSNIEYAVNKSIPLNLLETLIADTVKNAIIAINYSTNKSSKILVQFDATDCFEFRIYDTGIEFEIDTLIKLGKEQITTHKSSGGSGIGFITTFETLDKTNGSFIIEEYKNDKSEYSKCLIFEFDNKKQYIIRSYRAEEIKEKSNNELIVQSLLDSM